MAKFIHPYVEANIVDDNVTYLSASGLTNLFAVIESDKGESKLNYISSESEFIFKYGEPNFYKYGQAGYNTQRWLANGGGAYVYRVCPAKTNAAQFANITLGVRLSSYDDKKIKITTTTRNTTIKTNSDSAKNIVNISSAEFNAFNYKSLSSSKETFNTTSGINNTEIGSLFEIIRFVAKGKGVYGNNLGVRFYPTDAYSDTYNFQVYVLEVTELNTSGELITRESFFVALEEDAIDVNKNSMFAPDVLAGYSEYIDAFVNSYNYEKLFEALGNYTTAISNGSDPLDITFTSSEFIKDLNAHFIDLKSSTNNDTKTDANYDGLALSITNTFTIAENAATNLDLASNDFIDFNSNFSVRFTNGSNGVWDANEKDNAYADAYKGLEPNASESTEIKTILDTLYTEVDVVLDANYGDTIRAGIIALAKSRQDHMCFIDFGSGIASATDSTAKRGTSVYAESTELVSYWTQYFKVTDANVGKQIQVSPTYFLASLIPSNDNLYGIQKNFVGPRRGIVTGFDTLGWNPTETEKTELYKNQINYCERDVNSVIFATQLTSKKQSTPLSDIDNARAIFRMKRRAIKIARSFRMEDDTNFVYGQLETAIRNDLSEFTQNGALQSLGVTVYASAYDKQQKIARVKIDVVFTGTIERIIITFNVNR